MVLRMFQSPVIVRQPAKHNRNFRVIRSNRLKVVLVGEKDIRRSNKAAAKIGSHRLDYVPLPQKTVPATGSEICDAQSGHVTQALDLAPERRLRPGIQNIKIELAQLL